jgi:hypothetical protein
MAAFPTLAYHHCHRYRCADFCFLAMDIDDAEDFAFWRQRVQGIDGNRRKPTLRRQDEISWCDDVSSTFDILGTRLGDVLSACCCLMLVRSDR